MSDGIIRAPWTDEQVEALNRWQEDYRFHPFTCANDYCEQASLVAMNHGWVCQFCDYTQDWAHAFMVLVYDLDQEQRTEQPTVAESILRKMLNDTGGCFDVELGIVDVRVDFTENQQALLRRLRNERR